MVSRCPSLRRPAEDNGVREWQRLAILAGLGVLGTWSRYALGGLVPRLAGTGFPWGTLVINALGCFLCGAVWAMAENRDLISTQTRMLILIGFMGAFTTFSSYALETDRLLQNSQWGYALANILAQNVLGLTLLFAGFALVRWLWKEVP
jgi:fluoride exporter